MAGINKVILIGHVGRNPELREFNGRQRASFSLATSRSWRDKDGQRQEQTTWHRIVVWGVLAELTAKYAPAGRQVYVEGSLETREYTHNGAQQRVTEVVAQQVQFLGKSADRPEVPKASQEDRATASHIDDMHPEEIPF